MRRRYRCSLIFFIAVFSIISFVSCKDNNPTNYEAEIVLEKSSITVPNVMGEHTIDLVSNMAWQVESNVDWISFPDSTSGEKGKFTLAFFVDQNEGDERTGIINFSTKNDASAELEVMQEAGNKDNIYVKVDGTGDGLSWADATSLENALELAVTDVTIHIAEGTYTPSTTVTGGNSSDEGDKTFEIKNNITIIGGYSENATEGEEADPGQYSTILSGGEFSNHVVTVTAPKGDGEEKVIIQGLIISNGHNERSQSTPIIINGINFPQNRGGGIIIGGSTVDIIDSKIVDNHAGQAGGIYAFEGTVLNMVRSMVNNNAAEHHNGGIWIRDGSTAFVYDSEFKANESGGVGAAVYCYNDSQFYIYNSVIADNKGANHGGGYYIRRNSTGNLVNVIIANNSLSGGTGAGIFMYDNSELNVISSTITQNHTAGESGGVYLRNGINLLNIYNSIISGNGQEENDAEVATAEDDAPVPVYHASIIENITYNDNSEQIDDSFNPSSMFNDLGDGIFMPTSNSDNPAIQFGLSADALIKLGGSLAPVVEEEIISEDIFNNSREGLNTMGSVISVE